MAGSGTAHLRSDSDPLLRAEHLVVEFPVGSTDLRVHAVSDVSLDVLEGETLGLVGESGCGKSTTGRALMQLPRPTSGEVRFKGTELTTLPGDQLRRVRPEMQMIFQDPISSLNPRRKVGDIVAEPLNIWASETHPPGPTIRLARQALLADAALRAATFLLMLLLVLINSGIPGLFGVQIGVATGFDEWLRGSASSMLFGVLLAGTASFALTTVVRDRAANTRLLTGLNVVLSLVFLLINLGTFGLLVEPGLSTVGAIVAFIGTGLAATAFVLTVFSGKDLAAMAEVRAEHDRIVRRVLTDVGIEPDNAMGRRPHQFSGGQCQRICIARALVLDPKVIICDEPVSALDVSVQAQILNLLEDMKIRYGLTLVFIAHDLAVVKNVSDRVAVMYLGKLCEVATPDVLYRAPMHPYTAALLDAIPEPDPMVLARELTALSGEIPSPVAPPSGCRFRTRCPSAQDRCAEVEPEMRQVGTGHYVACHFPLIGPQDAASIPNGQTVVAPLPTP